MQGQYVLRAELLCPVRPELPCNVLDSGLTASWNVAAGRNQPAERPVARSAVVTAHRAMPMMNTHPSEQ